MVQHLHHYKSFAHQVAHHSPLLLKDNDIKDYKKLAMAAVVDFLKKLEKSYCLKADPTGKLKLLYARDLAKHIKEAKKSNRLSDEAEQKLLFDVRKNLPLAIYDTVALPMIGIYLH